MAAARSTWGSPCQVIFVVSGAERGKDFRIIRGKEIRAEELLGLEGVVRGSG